MIESYYFFFLKKKILFWISNFYQFLDFILFIIYIL